MSCSLCHQHTSDANKRTNGLIFGTKNLNRDTIKDRKSSKHHIHVRKAVQGKSASEDGCHEGTNQPEDGPEGLANAITSSVHV